ncbi:uncharacterized protein BDZ99DRAFT_531086 [Mytilinidion resinicola]|uniref:Uncharacterized protein n=1 Tax=Mytilinidion resinicola TaxID=574789 RepID=A0A6A6Z9L9_9PEZI|nr:uncharacterized protein BDZ99DRAFT_531086 [Mytilinidion resinicola]KAF2817822.1 hypothetical protein BDZ99DRAFT_531086 [Mytilinidion resinicola]
MPVKLVYPEFEAKMSGAAMVLHNLFAMSGSPLAPSHHVLVTKNLTPLPVSLDPLTVMQSPTQAGNTKLTSTSVANNIDTTSGSQTEDSIRRSPLATFLTESDRYVPIFDGITCSLPVSGLLNLKLVSKDLQDVYVKAQKSQWNADKALFHFFKDPTGFRDKLGEVSGLISGIFVLQFLDRAPIGNMLDLYATYGPQADALEKYLIETEGYFVSAEETAPVPTNPNISRSRKAQTFRRARNEGLHIYLSHTNSAPLLDILRGDAYSTATTAIMTATKVYAPFANMTFRSDKAYILRKLDENAQTHLIDIEQTGREVLDIRFKDKGMAKHRHLNDSRCWVMNLDTSKLATPAIPDYVYDNTEFFFTDNHHRLSPAENRDGPLHYNCLLSPLMHPGLKYPWLGCFDAEHRKNAIVRRLDAVVWAELWKLRDQDRPINWAEMMRRPMLVRDMTAYAGKTFDEKVPEWIKELDELKSEGED